MKLSQSLSNLPPVLIHKTLIKAFVAYKNRVTQLEERIKELSNTSTDEEKQKAETTRTVENMVTAIKGLQFSSHKAVEVTESFQRLLRESQDTVLHLRETHATEQQAVRTEHQY
jgi:hypothetical protein